MTGKSSGVRGVVLLAGLGAALLTMGSDAAEPQWEVICFHPDDPTILGSVFSCKNGDRFGGAILRSGDDEYHAAVWDGGPDEWVDLHPGGYMNSWISDFSADDPVGVAGVSPSRTHAMVWRQGDPDWQWFDLHPTGHDNNSYIYGASALQLAGLTDEAPINSAWMWDRDEVGDDYDNDRFIDLTPAGAGHSCCQDTDGVHQVGNTRFDDEIPIATIWSGSPQSYVIIAPPDAEQSNAMGIQGDTQVGYATYDGVDRACVWHNTAESYVDVHPDGALYSIIFRTTGTCHCGNVRFGDNTHASVWFGDSADGWFDLHTVLGSEYETGLSRAESVYQVGEEIWVVGQGKAEGGVSKAMMWHTVIEDCNDNGISDYYDVLNCDGEPWCSDCNENGIIDECDILEGTSEDRNLNGVPDECECLSDVNGDGDVDINDVFGVLTYWGECDEPCPPFCTGDITFDCLVDIDDLFEVLANWGPCDKCPWDLNRDDFVDTHDLQILLDHYGECPDPPAECPWDFNDDGVVDDTDMFELIDHYGPCPT